MNCKPHAHSSWSLCSAIRMYQSRKQRSFVPYDTAWLKRYTVCLHTTAGSSGSTLITCALQKERRLFQWMAVYYSRRPFSFEVLRGWELSSQLSQTWVDIIKSQFRRALINSSVWLCLKLFADVVPDLQSLRRCVVLSTGRREETSKHDAECCQTSSVFAAINRSM